MNQYCDILSKLHPHKFKAVKKKNSDLILQINSYQNQVNTSKILFEESIELAAKMHYEKGKNLSFNNLKEDNRKAAKHFKWAYEYIPNYLDARQKYIDLKDLAVTRMGFTTFKSGKNFNQMGNLIVNMVLKEFMSNPNQFEFFEILDRTHMNALMLEYGIRKLNL